MRVVREIERCIAAIKSQNAAINAFVSVRPHDDLLRDASESNQRHDAGKTSEFIPFEFNLTVHQKRPYLPSTEQLLLSRITFALTSSLQRVPQKCSKVLYDPTLYPFKTSSDIP